MKILHVGCCDKFLPPFIDFIKENFEPSDHEFLLYSGMGEGKNSNNVRIFEKTLCQRLKYYFLVFVRMHVASKVIFHGLFDAKLVFILFFCPWLLKKCYWVIWGGDLYVYKLGKRDRRWKIKEFFRRPVIKRIGHLVTYIEGDVSLARDWYGAQGKYHECIMYTSNLYKDYVVPERKKTNINIQVGNSADPSNNHIEALKRLLPFKDENIAIYVPLSYGDKNYAQLVIRQGYEWFGDKFNPLTKFMPFEQYLEFLGIIDIAIFNHRRQQAMGNIITLLGLGKSIYIRSDVTQWKFFQEKNIVIGNLKKMEGLYRLNVKNNKIRISQYFSKDNMCSQLQEVFIS